MDRYGSPRAPAKARSARPPRRRGAARRATRARRLARREHLVPGRDCQRDSRLRPARISRSRSRPQATIQPAVQTGLFCTRQPKTTEQPVTVPIGGSRNASRSPAARPSRWCGPGPGIGLGHQVKDTAEIPR